MRTGLTYPLVLLVLALSATGATPSEEKASWVLSADEPRLDETFQAWLVLPSTAGTELDITLVASDGLNAWQQVAGQTCSAPPTGAQRAAWHGSYSSRVIPVCVRAVQRVSTKLVAVLHWTDGDGRSEAVTSEAIKVRDARQLGPAMLAVISALVGLIAGALSHVFSQAWDRHKERVQLRERFALQVVKALLPEMQTNDQRLADYLTAAGSTAPEQLDIKGYNTILAAKGGFLSFLRDEERRRWLKTVYDLYHDVTKFNNDVIGKNFANTLELARTLRTKLAGFVG